LVERTPPSRQLTQEQRIDFIRCAARIAWWLWRRDPGRTLFSPEELSRAIKAARQKEEGFRDRQTLIEDLCNAGLIVPVRPIKPGDTETPYLFTHRTFQEYLAALALTRHRDAVDIALDHVYDLNWQPVLQLLGGVLQPSRVVEYVRALLLKNE